MAGAAAGGCGVSLKTYGGSKHLMSVPRSDIMTKSTLCLVPCTTRGACRVVCISVSCCHFTQLGRAVYIPVKAVGVSDRLTEKGIP